MSTTASPASGRREPAEKTNTTSTPPAKKPRLHIPGGATLGKDNGREARRIAAVILDVLAGVRTPGQAAEALTVSQPRYFQLETRAMHALVESCEARPRGRVRSPERELAELQRRHERVQRELARQQTLVRMAQRTIGLSPPAAAPAKNGKHAKKKWRRPTVRALSAAAHLQQQSKEATAAGVPVVEEANA
jgi:hypothetical protein